MLDLLKYLLGLGFVGAVITLIVTVYRARVQTIHYGVDVLAVHMNESEWVKITVTDPQGNVLQQKEGGIGKADFLELLGKLNLSAASLTP